jgi:hypothetical protein
MIELQDQKMEKMIQMLTNYEQDHNVLINRMNLMADKLNKLNGYSSDNIAKRNAIELPSSKNEEVIKEIVQIYEEQESIETLPSTQTKPPKPTSTPVIATSNQAEPLNETSTREELPNSLNRTDATDAPATTIEDESFKKTTSKNFANKKKSIKEEVTGVQLSDEDLRISILSDDELNKEVVAFLVAGHSDEAKELLNRHKELKKKYGIHVCVKM